MIHNDIICAYIFWLQIYPYFRPLSQSYLFALVAGDLGSIHSEYTTTSGKVVQLGIFSDKVNVGECDGDFWLVAPYRVSSTVIAPLLFSPLVPPQPTNPPHLGKLEHAMYSIKRSMKWDEDVFGLECDLDLYNIVATNDFNMGAMWVGNTSDTNVVLEVILSSCVDYVF